MHESFQRYERPEHLDGATAHDEMPELTPLRCGPGITDADEAPESLLAPAFADAEQHLAAETVEVFDQARLVSPVRRPGELERLNPDIEPLPPTPIALDAEDRLREWGLSAKQIGQLQEYTSSFRYDLVPERIDRIIAHGAYAARTKSGAGRIILPNYHSYEDRGDGDCVDLSIQLGSLLRGSGFMDEINLALRQQGQPELQATLTTGNMRAHFTAKGDTHSWLNIVRGQDITTAVTVDPSMQRISLGDTTGYVPHTMRWANRTLRCVTAGVFTPGAIRQGPRGVLYSEIKDFGVLGRSTDSKVIYGLGFVLDVESVTYGAILKARLPDGTFDSGYAVHRGDIKRVGNTGSDVLTPTHEDEMLAAIEAFAETDVVFDQERARQILQQSEKNVWF